jgi:hypothetical protein
MVGERCSIFENQVWGVWMGGFWANVEFFNKKAFLLNFLNGSKLTNPIWLGCCEPYFRHALFKRRRGFKPRRRCSPPIFFKK